MPEVDVPQLVILVVDQFRQHGPDGVVLLLPVDHFSRKIGTLVDSIVANVDWDYEYALPRRFEGVIGIN